MDAPKSTNAGAGLAVFPPKLARKVQRRVYGQLRDQGFALRKGRIVNERQTSKEALRNLHLAARTDKATRELARLADEETSLLQYFADGSHVEPEDVAPIVTEVKAGTEAALVYRYASLLWSVPVSQGFGRRKRFLVHDQANGKLIGLFALGDPVFNLTCRDEYVGWSAAQREDRLYNVMDLFVLGAVPPYNQILGGKLVAYIAASNETRATIERAYHRKKTTIQGRKKHGGLALLTTSSALGQSALYSRIRYDGQLLYEPLGETKGWGHFHLNHGLFEELTDALEQTVPGRAALNRFGNGPNWKLRTARQALRMAGLPDSLMRHGVRRQVFAIHVSDNALPFLKGEHERLRRRDLPMEGLIEHWKDRWMRGRVQRRPEFREWDSRAIMSEVRTGTNLQLPALHKEKPT